MVREELAALPPGSDDQRRAEAAAIVRFGGALRVRGGGRGLDVAVDLPDGAAARRLRAHLLALHGEAPEVQVHRPTNLRGSTWRTLVGGGQPALQALRIVDADGRPRAGVDVDLVASAGAAAAYVRGALLAAGSVSDPRRAPHLEVRAPGERSAEDLAALVDRCVHAPGAARASAQRERWRVAVKSAAAIGAVLAVTGAHGAFLRWEDARVRGALRAGANRAANADRANVARTLRSAERQVRALQRLVDAVGFDALPADLAPLALARLANPEASLSELGGLLEPALPKTSVHRRLQRLAALAEDVVP